MTLPLDEQRCSNCRFYLPANDSPEGDCRRYPPTGYVTPAYRILSKSGRRYVLPEPDMAEELWHHYFPLTASDSWCGEWVPRPEAELPGT